MRDSLPALLLAVAAALPATGCIALYPGTSRPVTMEELRREEGWTLLESVPDVRQVSEQGCGAACLSMVLGYWGLPVPAEVLEKECAAAGLDGLRAGDLRDAARRRGFSAFLFRGKVEDLRHELERGRPILVGLIKSGPLGVTSHFEVVIGIDPRRRQVAVRDPALGLLRDSLDGFEGEWSPTGFVTLVVFLRKPEAAARIAAGSEEEQGGG
jgi:ABC-type bacteriocin/lantibiotic exporter with double-glycine peptidase domain